LNETPVNSVGSLQTKKIEKIADEMKELRTDPTKVKVKVKVDPCPSKLN